MKIYGDICSGNCDKVRFTAGTLGRTYEWIEIDSVRGGTRTPGFLAINPQGQVPVLVLDDGRSLAQSNAIVRFLAEGTPLLPTDGRARAKVDEWMFWESNNHEFHIAGCIAHMTYMEKSKESRDPMRVERGYRALDIMEGHLRDNNWFVGPNITIADIVLFAYTRNADKGGFELSQRSNIRAWIARCGAALGSAVSL